MGVELPGWDGVAAMFRRLPDRFRRATAEASDEEGRFLKQRLAAFLGGGISPAPSAFASALTGRSSSTALAGLAKYVIVKRVGEAVFVGVAATGGRGGFTMADIAGVHAEGRSYLVPMTDRQRKWFFAQMRDTGLAAQSIWQGGQSHHTGQTGGAIIRVTIPRRAWLQPAMAKFAKPDDVGARFAERLGSKVIADFHG